MAMLFVEFENLTADLLIMITRLRSLKSQLLRDVQLVERTCIIPFNFPPPSQK